MPNLKHPFRSRALIVEDEPKDVTENSVPVVGCNDFDEQQVAYQRRCRKVAIYAGLLLAVYVIGDGAIDLLLTNLKQSASASEQYSQAADFIQPGATMIALEPNRDRTWLESIFCRGAQRSKACR